METAVDLVSIYLQLNGYFVQTEVPVVQRVPGGAEEAARFEQVTDVDILAVRFPSLAHLEEPREREEWAGTVALDPQLGAPKEKIDVILGEVKEGSSRINPRLMEPKILRAAVRHTGGCMPADLDRIVANLIEHGEAGAVHCNGGAQMIRLVAFGGTRPDSRGRKNYRVMPLADILEFLQGVIEDNDEVFKVITTKNSALSMIMLMNKLGLRWE
jgi:hypothetical protein